MSWARRVARFPLTVLVVSLAAVGGLAAFGGIVLHLTTRTDSPWKALRMEAFLAVATVSVQLLAGRFLERADRSAMGWPRPAIRPLAMGFGIGAAIQSLVVAVLASAGFYKLASSSSAARASDIVGAFILFFAVAIFEEVVMRGILYRQLERLLGSWVALVLTALFFGLGHGGNNGATTLSSLAIALEAGVLLAAAYAYTRALWLPIGIHWAWNFFEGPIFGQAVSGTPTPHLVAAQIEGPISWTGGVFGPEAGWPAVISCTLLGVAWVVLAARRGRMLRPEWMRVTK